MIDLLLVSAPSRAGAYGRLAPLAAVEPPVWAGLIARYALDRRFSVEILDAEAEDLDVETTALRIGGRNPRLVAFVVYGHQPSASTQCLPGAVAVARRLRSTFPDLRTLALGTHPSALPERTLREGPFTFVCAGEGPATIVELLRSLRDGTGYGCGEVPGLWWRGGGDTVHRSAPAPLVADLDRELPDQAWELLDLTRYRAHTWHRWTGDPAGGYAAVQTSLGCPFRCSFCCINAPFTAGGDAPRFRQWSAENVVGQLGWLVERGITNVKIPDEMFFLDPRHVREICAGLIANDLGPRLNLWAYARVDTVRDPGLLDLARRAGFRWLGIGVESGSAHVRDGVEKGRFDDRAIRAAIARVRAAGIAVAANYIFGLPDDTVETMRATLDLACDLNTEWANFYCAMAYPGSTLHRTAVERGWALPEDPGGPGWVGYAQHAREALPLRTEALAAAEVLDFRDDAFLAYFGRPAYQALVCRQFGYAALGDVVRFLDLGRPTRGHRE